MQINPNIRSIIAVNAGPMAPLLGGVLATPGAALSKLFDFAGQNAARLVNREQTCPLRSPSGLPTPFQLPAEIMQNPMGALGSVFGANGPASILAKLLEMLQQGSAQNRLTSFNPFQGSSQFFPEMGEARFNRGIQGGTTIMGPDPLDGVWTPPAGSNITLADVAPTTASFTGGQGGASEPTSRLEALFNQFKSFLETSTPEQTSALQTMMDAKQQMIDVILKMLNNKGEANKKVMESIRG